MIAQLLAIAYALGVMLVAGFLIGDEISFSNPRYLLAIAIGVTWPIVAVLVVFQWITGVYVEDVYKKLKKYNE
jgi:hypothetical protein